MAFHEDLTPREAAAYRSGRWLTEDDRSWFTRGLCVHVDNPDLWFSHLEADQLAAVEVCQRCPVKAQCKAEGDLVETPSTTWGVRGGETELQRRRRRRFPRRSG
jgi:Transcription factor WhiB